MRHVGKLFVGCAICAVAVNAASLGTASAARADQKVLIESGAWRAIEATQGGRTVCFVITSPTSRAPADLKRDPGNLFVTAKPTREGGGTEVSIRFGYRLASSAHSLVIDGRSFALMPQGETAWLRTAADERTVVDQMRSGRELTVSAVSGRGNATTDTYSLMGFTAALATLEKQCRP